MISRELHERRIGDLRISMRSSKVDVTVIPVKDGLNWETCFYFSGFRGSSGVLVITDSDAFLLTDGRYIAQASEQTVLQTIDQGSVPIIDVLGKLLSGMANMTTLGLQADRVTCDLYQSIRKFCKNTADISPLISALRRRKDTEEVRSIISAAAEAAEAFERTLVKSENRFSEKAFAAALEYEMKMGKAEGGWGLHDFIVASGPRSALPHGVPTDRGISPGESVTVDFGARYGGYICDITRTFSIGDPPAWIREAHGLVAEAQAAAIPLLEPGRPVADADKAARSVIEKAGFGEMFIHGLGHGIGLDLHEAPVVSFRSDERFVVGDVVTLEPGIYFPGKGGVRLEDDFHITDNGPVCLTPQLPGGIIVLDR